MILEWMPLAYAFFGAPFGRGMNKKVRFARLLLAVHRAFCDPCAVCQPGPGQGRMSNLFVGLTNFARA